MEKNVFLDLLEKDLDQHNGVNEDSIESLLNHISNLHNTVGRSYEYLVEVISSLVKSAQQGKANEQAQRSIKGYENQVTELKTKIKGLEDELARSRERTNQLEREGSRKDDTIQELEEQLEKANEKIKANTRKDFTMFKLSTDRDFTTREESKESKSNKSNEDNSSLKRKYDDISKPVLGLPMSEVEENNNERDRSKSKSSTKSKGNVYGGEEADGFDDFKFKKVFKKVKRNENSKEREDESASTPVLMAFNQKKQSEITITRPSQSINFDEDNSLQNLLNNFLDTKETSIKSTFIRPKKDENSVSKSVSSPVHREKLVPKSDDEYNFDGLNDKIYRKGGPSVGFSQKSPLKSLDLPFESDTGNSQIPITRGGRFGNNNNLMQRMMMGNKKRNSTEPSNQFKMSSQRNIKDTFEPKGKTSVEDSDLVRESHRSKREREGLQGYGCDQCDKFYNHIADGIHIKSAEEITDRCSRHRDKFPLPSTPEKFHDNFSLNTQD